MKRVCLFCIIDKTKKELPIRNPAELRFPKLRIRQLIYQVIRFGNLLESTLVVLLAVQNSENG